MLIDRSEIIDILNRIEFEIHELSIPAATMMRNFVESELCYLRLIITFKIDDWSDNKRYVWALPFNKLKDDLIYENPDPNLNKSKILIDLVLSFIEVKHNTVVNFSNPMVTNFVSVTIDQLKFKKVLDDKIINCVNNDEYENIKNEFIKNKLKLLYEEFSISSRKIVDESIDEYLVET